MTRRTNYRVAGVSLAVETMDRWAAYVVDAFFERWYLAPDEHVSGTSSGPAIVISSETEPPAIPAGLQQFEVAGGGTCHTDTAATFIHIDGCVVATRTPGRAAVEVWLDGRLPLDAPALTRAVTYALAAALRQRRRFELHSGALVDPQLGRGVLITGPSGSGKSTMTVHLASAGWSFLTDDVLVLGTDSGKVNAWPLRRPFAVTSHTLGSSRVLQARTPPGHIEIDSDGKQHFLPDRIFPSQFTERCVPGTLLFPELTGAARTRVSRLPPADTMARLIRMNPWSCYDRSTAAEHLAALSALTRQCAAYAVLAGRDLLDPEASVAVVSACVREEAA